MDDWAMTVVDAAHDVKARFDRIHEVLRGGGGGRGEAERDEERSNEPDAHNRFLHRSPWNPAHPAVAVCRRRFTNRPYYCTVTPTVCDVNCLLSSERANTTRM